MRNYELAKFSDLVGQVIYSAAGMWAHSMRSSIFTDAGDYVLQECSALYDSKIGRTCGDIEDIINQEIISVERKVDSADSPYVAITYTIETERGKFSMEWHCFPCGDELGAPGPHDEPLELIRYVADGKINKVEYALQQANRPLIEVIEEEINRREKRKV
jgi:hypothetical protein